MKRIILGLIVLALIVVNIKVVFSDTDSCSIEEIGLQTSLAQESSSKPGKCQQVSYSYCEREVQTNGSLPDGMYFNTVTAYDCWSGSQKQCSRGTIIATTNIAGQTVSTSGELSSVSC